MPVRCWDDRPLPYILPIQGSRPCMNYSPSFSRFNNQGLDFERRMNTSRPIFAPSSLCSQSFWAVRFGVLIPGALFVGCKAFQKISRLLHYLLLSSNRPRANSFLWLMRGTGKTAGHLWTFCAWFVSITVSGVSCLAN